MGGACGTYGSQERCIQDFGRRPEGKRQLGRLDVDGRIILKLISKKWDGEVWSRLIWLSIGTGGGRL